LPPSLPALVELLKAWLDYYPAPQSGSAECKKNAFTFGGTGRVPGRRVDCKRCQGTGKRKRGKSISECLVCGGAGRVWIDPNMNSKYQVIAENAEPQDKGEADRRVAEFLLRYELEERDAVYAFDRHIQRRELSPTYQELQHGMDILRAERPLGHTLIVACYVYPLMEPCALLSNLRAELVRGMVLLQAGLVDMRVPDWAIVLVAKREEAERTRRNEVAKGNGADKRKQSMRDITICREFQLGVAPQDLAEEYGISVRRVYQVIEGVEVA
jgi:hypothetical protein